MYIGGENFLADRNYTTRFLTNFTYCHKWGNYYFAV